MMTEELKVKVTVDTSEVQKATNKIKQSFDSVGGQSKKLSSGADSATEGIRELRDQMEMIRDMKFLDLALNNLDKMKESVGSLKKSMSLFGANFKDAFSDLKGAFNFKNFDVGGDGLKGIFQSMKVQGKESLGSLKSAFTHLGAGVKSFGTIIKGVMSSAVVAIGLAVAAVFALIAAFKNAINTAKRVKELTSEANKLNMSIGAYQEWAYVLEHVGVGVDKLSDFLKTLADEQNAVRDGSEDIIKAFNQLGMSADEVANMSQQELFRRTVQSLQNIEDVTLRTSIAYRIFGEDAAELNNVLRMSNSETAELVSNFELLGGAMSASLIEKSNTLNASLANLRVAWTGLTNTLAELFMPVITAVVNGLTKAIAAVNMFIRVVFGMDVVASSPVEDASASLGGYTSSVDKATSAVEKLKRTTQGFDELNIVRDPNTSSASGSSGGGISGGGIGGGGNLPTLDTDKLGLGKMKEWFEKYKTLIQDITTWSLIGIGVLGCILCLFTGHWVGAAFFAGMAGIGFMMGQENGAFERMGERIKGWWNDLKVWFNTKVKPVFTKQYWSKKWDEIKKACAEGLDKIGQALFGSKWESIKKWFNDKVKPVFTKQFWVDGWNNIRTSVSDGLDKIKSKMDGWWSTLSGWFNNKVKPIFTKQYWVEKFNSIKQGIEDRLTATKTTIDQKWAQVTSWFNSKVAPIFTKQYWLDKFNTFKEAMGQKLDETKQNLEQKWAAVSGWFKENIAPIFTKEYWIEKFETFRVAMQEKFEETNNKIQELWGTISGWFKQNIAPIFTKDYWLNKFETIRSSAETKLENTRQKIEEKWNVISGWFKTYVAPIFTKEYWMNKFETFRAAAEQKLGDTKKKIEEVWNNIKNWFNTNVAPKFTAQYWKDKWDGVRAGAAEKLENAKTTIQNKWTEVKNWFNTNVAPKFTKSYWTGKFDTMRAAAAEKIQSVKDAFSGGWSTIKSWFNNNVASKFTTSYWSGKFDSIRSGAKSAMNGAIAVVEKAINYIVGKLNTVKFSIPSWVPVVGGKSFGISLNYVSIPRLATGGIATRSMLANIGENGREAVLPLENNTGWMDVLADRIAARQAGPTKIVLKVGEQELGWATIHGINQITKQTGELQLAL